MAISDKITSITNHLIDDYKALENLGASVTDRNIENIKDMAEQIYDNYPKTEYGEGTSITLENCNKGKLDIDKLEGDTEQDGEPTPTNPITINSVTGNQEVVVRGINIFDGEMESGTINSTTGNPTPNSSQIRSVNYTDIHKIRKIGIVPNDTSTPTRGLRFYDKDYNYLGSATLASNNIVNVDTASLTNTTQHYTSNADIYYIKFVITTSTDLSIKYGIIDNSTTYEPYYTPITKQLSLGDIELCKIGTYQDYIYKNTTDNKWYLHKEVGKVTLNGTENWTVSQSGTSNWYYALPISIGGITDPTTQAQLKSNYYKYASITSSSTDEGIWYSTNYIRIRYGTQDTKENFKTWLSTHNVILVYALSTPTLTEITDTTLIEQLENWYNAKSFNGTTILESNGNLPIIIKARALKGV